MKGTRTREEAHREYGGKGGLVARIQDEVQLYGTIGDDAAAVGVFFAGLGEIINDKYEVIGNAGQGHFATVYFVRDIQTGEQFALKVCRSLNQFFQQAQYELRVLKSIGHQDPEEAEYIAHCYESFTIGRHQCFLFPKLSVNVYDAICQTNGKGVSLQLCAWVGYQILHALSFLDQMIPSGVIHTDLVQLNAIVTHVDRSRRILCWQAQIAAMFASLTLEVHDSLMIHPIHPLCRVYTIVPLKSSLRTDTEVPLSTLARSKFSLCSMWSLACILVELLTCDPLFEGEDDVSTLAAMLTRLGTSPPSSVVNTEYASNKYFAAKAKRQHVCDTTSHSNHVEPYPS